MADFKGVGALIVGVAAVLAILVAAAITAHTLVLVIVAGAVAAVVILHFWNKRPVKTPEDDQIRLNLDKK